MSDDNFYYKEKHDKFYVLNIGDKLDKLFSDIFPNKLKYINRFKLILKEEIIFPNNFNLFPFKRNKFNYFFGEKEIIS